MRKVSIVIPSFNEEENIPILVNQIDIALIGIDYEIIFVDDSTDRTPEVISGIMQNDNKVRMHHRINEKGLASAVICGFNMAMGDYIAVMDADLQHPPAILRPMYAAMESGTDFCIPSRFIPGGSDGGLNLYRKIVSGTARYIGKIMLPCLRKVTDPTSGLFMFRKKTIEGADLRPIGWKIMVEVLAMARYSQIVEIPYTFQERINGNSKLDSRVTFQYLEQCLNLRKRYVKNSVRVEKWSVQKMNEMTN